MKRILICCLVVCILMAASACGQTQQEPTEGSPTTEATTVLLRQDTVFEGLILADLGEDLLVTECKARGKTQGMYVLPESCLAEGEDAGKLVPGTYITLDYNGVFIETYPMQFERAYTFTCGETKEDVVLPLMRFIVETVPESAQWVLLDLNSVVGLSAGERMAVCYLAENELDGQCSVVRYDRSKVTAEDMLTADDSPENGVLLTVEGQIADGEMSGTWQLNDTHQVIEGTWNTAAVYHLN